MKAAYGIGVTIVLITFLVVGFLFAGGGCAHAPARPVERSPVLGCDLPPPEMEGKVRAFCQEFPDKGVLGCGYVGYRDGKLCLDIFETEHCGPWKPYQSMCGISLLIVPPMAERSSAPKAMPPGEESL